MPGMVMASKMALIATTIIASMSVKPWLGRREILLLITCVSWQSFLLFTLRMK
jgi:hypothetical protein